MNERQERWLKLLEYLDNKGVLDTKQVLLGDFMYLASITSSLDMDKPFADQFMDLYLKKKVKIYCSPV
jgi:hypothetical protein